MDVSGYPAQKAILARTLPILRAAGADVAVDGGVVRIHPTKLNIPAQPQLPVEPELALFLLALPLVLGGETRLAGQWPQWPAAEAGWRILRDLGLDLQQQNGKEGEELNAQNTAPLKAFSISALPADLPADWSLWLWVWPRALTLRGGQTVRSRLAPGTAMQSKEAADSV